MYSSQGDLHEIDRQLSRFAAYSFGSKDQRELTNAMVEPHKNCLNDDE